MFKKLISTINSFFGFSDTVTLNKVMTNGSITDVTVNGKIVFEEEINYQHNKTEWYKFIRTKRGNLLLYFSVFTAQGFVGRIFLIDKDDFGPESRVILMDVYGQGLEFGTFHLNKFLKIAMIHDGDGKLNL